MLEMTIAVQSHSSRGRRSRRCSTLVAFGRGVCGWRLVECLLLEEREEELLRGVRGCRIDGIRCYEAARINKGGRQARDSEDKGFVMEQSTCEARSLFNRERSTQVFNHEIIPTNSGETTSLTPLSYSHNTLANHSRRDSFISCPRGRRPLHGFAIRSRVIPRRTYPIDFSLLWV